MTPDIRLAAALEAAYDALSPYPVPTRLDAAPGRRPARILADLTSAPLRELPCERIGSYAGWAITTVGVSRDYKHFLPRLLELSVEGGCAYVGLEPFMLAGKIVHAGFGDWRPVERAAIGEVFHAAWLRSLDLPLVEAEAENWLCGDLILGGRLPDRLAAWLANPSLEATLHIARALFSEAVRDPGHEAPGWSDLPDFARTRFLQGLSGVDVRVRLEAALPLAGEDEWVVSAALDFLKAGLAS
ncbi:MAG: hypothetical protein J7521_13290 [Caulobacter sp.]|nr:hypothetical protein [Caulobacter sp.]